MGKQARSKKTESLGKGKVTPIQIAFVVDRYLHDNSFLKTREIFRAEASSLISKSSAQKVPQNLLSLGAMLNQYVCLKEQKVTLNQEAVRLEQQKSRVQTLLKMTQDAVNVYNASASMPELMNSQSGPFVASPTAVSLANINCGNQSLETTNPPWTRKRNGTNATANKDTLPEWKRPCFTFSSNAMLNKGANPSAIGSLIHAQNPNLTVAPGFGVARSLFGQKQQSSSAGSPCSSTPPQECARYEKSSAPPVDSSNAYCSRVNSSAQRISQVPATNSSKISSERISAGLCKETPHNNIEMNNRVFSTSPLKSTMIKLSNRDCVKEKVQFDKSDATKSMDKPTVGVLDGISQLEPDQGGLFDIEFPDLDSFGPDFFSNFLGDLDLGLGNDLQYLPASGTTSDTPGSSPELS